MQRRLKRGLLAIGTAVVTVAATIAAVTLTGQPAVAAGGDSAINGFRDVAYFAQWGVYGRAYPVKKIVTAGEATKLTHINYAFANINNQTLQCFEANKAQGDGPNGSDGAGDAYADYGKSYAAGESVSGAADAWDQPLAGSFNQLKELKAAYPNIKVMLSIGGWTWSKNFSLAAATPASRQAFVSSCIDMFIKGNLPVIDGRGGTGAGAGVFDGFDIDWEWPGSANGNTGNYVDTVNDRANLKALLAEFRTQLDAYGAQTGKHYLLSAFLPANPADISAGGWNDPAIFNSLDYGNLQGYDFEGAWDPSRTGHQGNIYDDPADPRASSQQFSVAKALALYKGAGVPAAQLGLGMAMYGRGWTGVPSSTPWSSASGAAPGTWEAGIEDYDVLKTVGTEYFSSSVGAAWRYNGSQWWSLDTPQSVTQKSQYIRSEGLGGAMWWELSGDESGDLVTSAMNVLGTGAAGPVNGSTNPPPTTSTTTSSPTASPTGSPTGSPTASPTGTPTGGCSAAAWNAATAYVGGQEVSYNGDLWRAKWWTQNETPGASQWGPWEDLGPCSGGTSSPTSSPTPTGGGSCGAVAAWNSSAVYVANNEATYGGHLWQAKWWTQGDVPGADQWGPWNDLGAC